MDVRSIVVFVLALIATSIAVPGDKQTLVIDEEALVHGVFIPAEALKPRPRLDKHKEEQPTNDSTLEAYSDQISTTLNSDLPNNTENTRNPNLQNPQTVQNPAINQVNSNQPNLQGDLTPPLNYPPEDNLPKQPAPVINPQPSQSQIPQQQTQVQPVFNNQQPQPNSLLPYGYYPGINGYNTLGNIPQPTIFTQQPNMYNQHPNIYNQVPNIYNQQPNVYNQQPNIPNQQPNLYNQQPNLYNQQPNVYSPQHNVYNQQPNVNNMQPNMYSQQPNINNMQPNMYSPQPNVNNMQPNMYSPQPNAYNQQPGIYYQQPNVYNQPPNGNNVRPNLYIQPQNVYNQQPNPASGRNIQNSLSNPNVGAVINPSNSNAVPKPNPNYLYTRVPGNTQNNNGGYFIPVLQVPSNSGILLSTKIEEDGE